MAGNPVLSRQFNRPDTSPIVTETMSVGGVARAFASFGIVVLLGAAYGFNNPQLLGSRGMLFGVMLGALGVLIVATMRPALAKSLGFVYAALEGVFLGAISVIYESMFNGIIAQALLGVLITVMVMFALYATRTIQVTDRMRSLVMGATASIAVFYLVSFALSFFGVSVPLVWESGIVGIGFSLVVIAIAAFNLLIDFDFIERGIRSRAAEELNWYAALGLLVTIVWIYIEMLRLLSKLNSRD